MRPLPKGMLADRTRLLLFLTLMWSRAPLACGFWLALVGSFTMPRWRHVRMIGATSVHFARPPRFILEHWLHVGFLQPPARGTARSPHENVLRGRCRHPCRSPLAWHHGLRRQGQSGSSPSRRSIPILSRRIMAFLLKIGCDI